MLKYSFVSLLRSPVFLHYRSVSLCSLIAVLWPQKLSMKLTILVLFKYTINLLFFPEHKLYEFPQSEATIVSFLLYGKYFKVFLFNYCWERKSRLVSRNTIPTCTNLLDVVFLKTMAWYTKYNKKSIRSHTCAVFLDDQL